MRKYRPNINVCTKTVALDTVSRKNILCHLNFTLKQINKIRVKAYKIQVSEQLIQFLKAQSTSEKRN